MVRAVLLLILGALPILAATGKELPYKDGGTQLVGYLARPEAPKGRVPGVLIIHQWMGVTEHERMEARRLADLGYVALAADIYGQGIRPRDAKEAAAQAGIYKGDRALYRRRIRAGLNVLLAEAGVDPKRVAVIGFCFGGTGALEAARDGMPVQGVVSFHGGLDAVPDPAARAITAKVLVCHGADDPNVPPPVVAAFHDEMRRARADYTFIAYGGAVHAFTQKEAGDDPAKGVAYQEAAARRSWEHMRLFFAEIFGS
jgi:dienelactone hydrolase